MPRQDCFLCMQANINVTPHDIFYAFDADSRMVKEVSPETEFGGLSVGRLYFGPGAVTLCACRQPGLALDKKTQNSTDLGLLSPIASQRVLLCMY
jgi:hypothetical protein